MDLLTKSDEEIFTIGKPFWENLVRSSNLKDYGGFTRDFSTQMLFGANEVELGKQWANNKIITNLNETYEPFGTLKRGDHITVLIKQTNKEIPGEFLGRMVLGLEGDEIKRGFDKLHNWLKKNGKLYLTVVSPYVESLIEEFLPIYEHRAKDGEEWPGIIRNHNELAHRHAPFLGNFLHVFDIPQFKKLLPEHGFNIDKIEYFDYPNEAISSNNKGHIGFVATKV